MTDDESVAASTTAPSTKHRSTPIADSLTTVPGYPTKLARLCVEALVKAYVPLRFELGEAFQFDWSEEHLVIGDVWRKIMASHLKLCASRAFVVQAYPTSRRRIWQEAAQERFGSFTEINLWLLARCRALWLEPRHTEYEDLTIAEILEHEQPSLMPMIAPFDGYVETLVKIQCAQLVTFKRAPTRQK